MEPYQDDTQRFSPQQEGTVPSQAYPEQGTQAYIPPAETRYRQEPAPEDWREPVYTEPVRYTNAYSPTRRGSGYGEAYAKQQERQPRKPSRPMTRTGAVWLVVVCCLLCSALGGAAGWIAGQKTAQDQPATQVYLGGTADGAPASSATPTANPGSLTPSAIYSTALRQVVGISTAVSANVFGQTTSSAVSGTGFLISADGYILTNYHVIEYAAIYGGEMTVMFHDGSTYPASIVGFEDDNDIAVIKIDVSELEPVTFCSSMTVGESIYVVGNPLGELTYTMTSGCLSALDRVITTDTYSAVNMFQIDAAVNSGNSGGPVYNAAGQVIGIVSAKYASAGVEGIGFAIPIEDAVSIATQLIENGYVAGKAYLGVSVEDVTEAVAAYFNMPLGAYVNSVTDGSAAENAGMRTGDIITAMGDTAVASVADLKAALKTYHAGDTAAVTVYRSGELMTLNVILDEDIPKT